MTGSEKITDLVEDVQNMLDTINKNYGEILDKIDHLNQELDTIESKYKNNSETFKQDQRNKIQTKINRYAKSAEQYLDRQTGLIQNWLNERKKDIVKQIADSKIAMLKALI